MAHLPKKVVWENTHKRKVRPLHQQKKKYGLFRKFLNILIILYERPRIETWKLSIRVTKVFLED